MNKVFQIKLENRSKSAIAEHVVSSVFAFVGTYTILFFGPLLLGSRRGGRNGGIADEGLNFFVENQMVVYGISATVAVLYNLWIYYRNSIPKHVVEVRIDSAQQGMEVDLVNRYSNKRHTKSIPQHDFDIQLVTRDDRLIQLSSKQVYKLYDGKRPIGMIDPGDEIWSRYKTSIPGLIRKLSALRKNTSKP